MTGAARPALAKSDTRCRAAFLSVRIESQPNQMESQITATQRTEPRAISVKQKAYAFERSLGIPPAEACRRAGGKVENGHATKWERSQRVQAWIGHYRSMGQTEEMLAEKRQRVEDELRLVAHSNMADFVALKPSGESIVPVLDLTRINAMTEAEQRAALAAVKTVKYTENGPTFELHGKLDAIAQLRDMYGFKSVNKTALTDPSGEKPAEIIVTDADRAKALAAFVARNTTAAS